MTKNTKLSKTEHPLLLWQTTQTVNTADNNKIASLYSICLEITILRPDTRMFPSKTNFNGQVDGAQNKNYVKIFHKTGLLTVIITIQSFYDRED